LGGTLVAAAVRAICSNGAVAPPNPLERAGIDDAAAAARAMWREDEEEWTRAAVEQWHHGRTLVDVLRDHLHRGDTVAVTVGSTTVTGVLEAVGDDVVSVATHDGHAHARVGADTPVVLRVVSRAPFGGTRGRPITTFRARVLEVEADEIEVEVVTIAGDTTRGELRVARDHVRVLSADGETCVSFGAVAWVRVVAP
jgi:hypothetical protein